MSRLQRKWYLPNCQNNAIQACSRAKEIALEQKIECLKMAITYTLQFGGDPVVETKRYHDFVSGADAVSEYEKSAGYPLDDKQSIKASAN